MIKSVDLSFTKMGLELLNMTRKPIPGGPMELKIKGVPIGGRAPGGREGGTLKGS